MSDKVTMKEKISFALANLGNIPIQTILGSYLLIFYTNVIGLNPAACATLFLIARVMDALKDPFMGFLIDRLPTTKHGHFRPTLIVGTALCSLNFLLIWFAPLMATSGKLAIAYVTYLMIGVLFLVMDISLNSMLPVMTLDMEERSALSAQKGFVYTLGSFLVNLSAPVIIGNVSEKEGYITLVLIAAAVIAGCSIAGALGLKERVQAQPGKDSYQIKDLFRILGQKPVAITFSAALIYMIGKYVMNTTLAYFFTYVIGNLKLMSVVSVVQLCALLPATLLVGALIRKIGRKKAYMLSLTLIGTAPLLRLIDVTSIPILLAAMAIAGFADGLCMPLTYGIQADNTDYVELELGYRADAAIAALSGFITKCGMGVGGAIPGYILEAAGFRGEAQTQPPQVRTALIVCTIAVPAVMCVAGALLFGAYPLTKERLAEQVERVNAAKKG